MVFFVQGWHALCHWSLHDAQVVMDDLGREAGKAFGGAESIAIDLEGVMTVLMVHYNPNMGTSVEG